MSEQPTTLDRSAEEVIDALAMCAANGVGGFVLGDNEAARVVLSYRDFRAALAAALGREMVLRDALGELVALKDHKDRHGKDPEYLNRQWRAWDAARAALEVSHAR